MHAHGVSMILTVFINLLFSPNVNQVKDFFFFYADVWIETVIFLLIDIFKIYYFLKKSFQLTRELFTVCLSTNEKYNPFQTF